MTGNINGDEALVRALHVCDDGRDWTAWFVWRMGQRRRISEGVFTLPPVRPQVAPASIKPKATPRKRKRKPKPEPDF